MRCTTYGTRTIKMYKVYKVKEVTVTQNVAWFGWKDSKTTPLSNTVLAVLHFLTKTRHLSLFLGPIHSAIKQTKCPVEVQDYEVTFIT